MTVCGCISWCHARHVQLFDEMGTEKLSVFFVLLILQKCTLTVNWMSDGVADPTSDAIEEGYGSWLSKGCSSCIDELHKSNLLDLAETVDWKSIKEGRRPTFRVI